MSATGTTNWSWNEGERPECFAEAYRQWISVAEQAWCTISGIPEEQRAAHSGRAAGFFLKPTPVMQLAKKTLQPRVTADALAWRSLRGAAVALVGKRRRWEAGKGSLDTLMHTAVNMTGIDIEPINKQTGEFLNLALMISALLTDPIEELLDVLNDLQE